jgi:hypothetical protein
MEFYADPRSYMEFHITYHFIFHHTMHVVLYAGLENFGVYLVSWSRPTAARARNDEKKKKKTY